LIVKSRRAASSRQSLAKAVRDSRGHAADARGGQPFDHRIGHEHRGEVDVLDVDPQQGVAHRAADIARIPVAERGDQRGEIVALGPLGGWQLGGKRFSHASATGARG
jgi:hypothetical protein